MRSFFSDILDILQPMKNKKITAFLAFLPLILLGYHLYQTSAQHSFASSTYGASTTPAPQSGVTTPQVTRSKNSSCIIVDQKPDPGCTPGAILTNVTAKDICVSGYSKTVRNVPTTEKAQVYSEYDITQHVKGEYEVDHDISLELGGSNDISNLWPEAASPVPGFHQKDSVENYLHAQVCSGAMSLQDAQYKIANDWLSVYNQIAGSR